MPKVQFLSPQLCRPLPHAKREDGFEIASASESLWIPKFKLSNPLLTSWEEIEGRSSLQMTNVSRKEVEKVVEVAVVHFLFFLF